MQYLLILLFVGIGSLIARSLWTFFSKKGQGARSGAGRARSPMRVGRLKRLHEAEQRDRRGANDHPVRVATVAAYDNDEGIRAPDPIIRQILTDDLADYHRTLEDADDCLIQLNNQYNSENINQVQLAEFIKQNKKWIIVL